MSKDFSLLGNPEDTNLREYVVVVESHDQLDSLYEDIETEGGSDTIPERACECSRRKPLFRSTRYKLTYDEAYKLLNDERVIAVELTEEERKLIRVPYGWSSSGNFSKTTASSSTDLNWGFVRQLSLQQNAGVPTWGAGDAALNRVLNSDLSGKNVDVVIMDDGTPYASTLEYQQNADGTGYPRLIYYNWFQHKSPPEMYSYTDTATSNMPRLQEHGAHCMGTTAGNTHGWARDANIYFISFWDTGAPDYVLAFHLNKPINPETGVRNPTVMNNSWGYNPTNINWANVSAVTHRGINYSPTSGSAGSYVWDTTLTNTFWFNRSLTRNAEVDADYVDLINAGVIVVASAGNANSYADVSTGIDYNNSFVMSGTTYYPHRGSSPGAAEGVICVGAAGSHNETNGDIYSGTAVESGDWRAEFSNFGPRIDVWGSGSAIQSVWKTGESLYDNINAADPRVAALGLTDTTNNNFKKCPGTSMSGPNVCGVFACLAQAYPRMKQNDARNYITSVCTGATMQWTTGGIIDDRDLGYSKNTASGIKYMFLKGNRINNSELNTYNSIPYPSGITVSKPSSGLTYPRSPKIIAGSKASKATYALSVYKSTTYTYSVTYGSNYGSGYYAFSTGVNNSVDLGSNPSLSAKVGDTLIFTVMANGHPFWVKTTNTTNSSNAITANITNNGTQDDTITWNTTGLAPGTYYYVCQYHSSMKGTITLSAAAGNEIISSNGVDKANIVLTTTGIANGTKIPYLITSKYKGAGLTQTTVTKNDGLYIASNSSNTYSATKTGPEFGGGGYNSPLNKRHKINMSASNTNPTWIDDPNGWSVYDYSTPLITWTPATFNINVTASNTSSYTMSGTDRMGTVSGSDPIITVQFGDTINFAVNANNHPFYVKYTTVNGGSGNQITGASGVITNQGTQSGTVSLNTALLNNVEGSPLSGAQYDWQKEIIIYYQCGNHLEMRGAIVVRSGYPTIYNVDVECDLVTTAYNTQNKADDSYWKINVPWNIPIFGTNTNLIAVSTNSYITFGSGTHAWQNLQTLNLNKLLLAAGDGSSYSLSYIIYGTAPNRTLFMEYYGQPSTGYTVGQVVSTWWQASFKENDVNNIYVSVIQNGRYVVEDITDRYPFHQGYILGGQNTNGVFTINNNTATLTITPSEYFTPPSDVSSTGMNVNVRLGFYGSPNVDFNVT